MNGNPRRRVLALLILATIILTACAPAINPGTGETTVPTEGTADPTSPSVATPSEADPIGSPGCEDPFAGVSIEFSTFYWDRTDFCLHSVDYDEILSGGPPPDGIPPIDDPVFDSVEEASEWLGDRWPVMVFEWNGDTRAYPLLIMVWHEIVNDVVGDLPVTITFCPLCNATIVFDRTLPDGRVLDFGTSGNLRNSDLIMYDRQTESWWQQFTGEAIVGELTGTQLRFLPSQIIAWADFKENYPEGRVLAGASGSPRPYGQMPYIGYDDIDNSPFLFRGELDDRLPAMERVAALKIEETAVAFPFSLLSEVQVVNDTVSGEDLVVFWKSGTISGLDPLGAEGLRDIGSTGVYSRQVGDQTLTFRAAEGLFEDIETGSLWNIFGLAVDGPLAGSRLESLVSAEHFWFAWAAFEPDTVIWSATG